MIEIENILGAFQDFLKDHAGFLSSDALNGHPLKGDQDDGAGIERPGGVGDLRRRRVQRGCGDAPRFPLRHPEPDGDKPGPLDPVQ